MQRITCPERDDWRQTAEQCGFDFHTMDGERYWDERAYYAFTLSEIENEIETATPRSMRCASNSSPARLTTRSISSA